jgi:hypothetical protein
MSATRDLLADLDLIGARLEPAGGRLILRAGPTAIPAALVRRVREAKADLLATLAICTDRTVLRGDENREHSGNSPRHQAKDQAFDSLVVEWLNQHPTPSAPGALRMVRQARVAERCSATLRDRAGDACMASP